MAMPHVLSGLIAKRAEPAGEIEAAEARLRELRAALGHLDATILLFDPAFPVVGIRAKQPRRGLHLFGSGELVRLVFGVLREAGEPLTIREIAEAVMRAKSLPEHGRTRRTVERRVHRTAQRRADVIERARVEGGVRWRVRA